MRVFESRAGGHPDISSALHAWTFAQANNTDALHDMIEGGLSLTASGNPALYTQSPIESARSFNGSTQYFYSAGYGADVPGLTSDPFTLMHWAAPHVDFAARGCVAAYGGNGETLASNVLMRSSVTADMKLQMYWEYGSGTDQTFTSDVTIKKGKWVHVAWVWNTVDLILYVNGVLAQTWTPTSGPEGYGVENTQRWSIGVDPPLNDGLFYGHIASVTVHPTALSASEVQDAFRRGMAWYYANVLHVRVRVQTQDSTEATPSTFQDVSSFRGRDWLTGVDIRNDVDMRGPSATVKLRRDIGGSSLSKYHDNRNNRTPLTAIGPETSTYSADAEFLALNRRIDVSVVRLPWGVARPASDSALWQQLVDGVITGVSWADDDVTLTVMDRRVRMLQRGYMEAIKVWANNDGTPLSDEDAEAWREDPSGDTGEDLETVLQGILTYANDQGWIADDVSTGGAISLFVPISPSYSKLKFENGKAPILDVLNERAEKIGWMVTSAWDPATGAFRLTLHEPDRTKSVPDVVLGPNDYRSVKELSIEDTRIRNAVLVAWHSTEEATPSPSASAPSGFTRTQGGEPSQNGLPSRHWIQYVNTASQTKYGRNWMAVAEGGGSQIDTVDEAEQFALTMCRDLCEPTADQAVSAWAFPEIEVNDLIRWTANSVHYTTDQDLAATSVQMQLGAQDAMDIRCRGKPSGSPLRALQYDPRINGAIAPSLPGESYYAELGPARRRTGIKDIIDSTALIREPSNAVITNSDFESFLTSQSGPPFGWKMTIGTWGVEAELSNISGSGHNSIMLTDESEFESNKIPISSNNPYKLSVSVKSYGIDPGGYAAVRWYSAAKAYLSEDSFIYSILTSDFKEWFAYYMPPSDARYAAVAFGNSIDDPYLIDYARLEKAPIKFTVTVTSDQTLSNISGNVYGDTVSFHTEWIDTGNTFDGDAHKFVAPSDGDYFFAAVVFVKPTVANSTIHGVTRFDLNGSSWIVGQTVSSTSLMDGIVMHLSSGIQQLSAGDEVTVYVEVDDASGSTPKVQSGYGKSVFSGQKN